MGRGRDLPVFPRAVEGKEMGKGKKLPPPKKKRICPNLYHSLEVNWGESAIHFFFVCDSRKKNSVIHFGNEEEEKKRIS